MSQLVSQLASPLALPLAFWGPVSSLGLVAVLGLVAAFLPAWRVARRVLPTPTTAWERPLATSILGLAWLTSSVRLLLLVGLGRGPVLFAWFVGVALAGEAWATKVWARRAAPSRVSPPKGERRAGAQVLASASSSDAGASTLRPWPRDTWPLLAVAGAAVLLAVWAAVVLPIWCWDALGYHLPLVNFALRRGSVHDIPVGIPYLSTYPDGVEMVYLVIRSWLPSDDLVDLSQLGLGLVGVLALAHSAGSLGVERSAALLAGAAWLTFPAVFLQLPTNYVDVGVAAYLLASLAFLAFSPVTRRHLMLGGLALGLYLGSKPNALVPATLVGLLAAWRAWRARPRDGAREIAESLPLDSVPLGRWVAAAAGVTVLLGGSKYVANFVRFGNPLWPLAVHLGPFRLPGFIEVSTLLASGAKAPRPPAGPVVYRALRSWLTFPGHLVFDTRLGGLGPLFSLFALPGALVALVRRAWPRGLGPSLLVAAAVTLFHPEPSTPRFVLGWFGLVVVLAATQIAPLRRRRVSPLVLGLAALASAVGLLFAFPGLTGEAPSLLTLSRLPAEQRIRELNPNGAARVWQEFAWHLRPDDVVAFDESLSMPYLLWRADVSNRVVPLAWRESATAVAAVLDAEKATYLVAGDGLPASALAAAQPSRFRALFRCGADPCTVYQVLAQATDQADR